MNYRTEKRKANVGERILITNAGITLGDYQNGDVFEVKSLYKTKGVYVSDEIAYINHEEYEVITEARGMVNINFSEMSYDELVSHVDDAVTALRRRAYYEGYQQGKFDEQIDALMPTTAQAQRDAIVEQAKRDVAELKSGYNNAFYRVRGIFGCNAKFIVNAEKRTVVVLLLGVGSGKVRAKGIAKCAPTDCFNAHIGKAIALRRALGLEVPAEYLNAPQPTEVREGDVIDVLSYDTISVKTKSGRTGEIAVGSERNFIEKGYGKVVDDTRE